MQVDEFDASGCNTSTTAAADAEQGMCDAINTPGVEEYGAQQACRRVHVFHTLCRDQYCQLLTWRTCARNTLPVGKYRHWTCCGVRCLCANLEDGFLKVQEDYRVCGVQLEDIPVDCSQHLRTLSCSGPGVVTNFFADSDKCASAPCRACVVAGLHELKASGACWHLILIMTLLAVLRQGRVLVQVMLSAAAGW